jgi:tRNA A-37 threonylcarbamoyl transferase component Bud32
MTNAMPTRLTAALADRYAIERELGQGGMATVYLAEDLRHHRKVALKVLREDLAATLGTERFHREIQIAAQLQHPHILPLLDSGEAAGFLYYVMPYVEGQSVRDRLAREGALPVSDAVRILRDVVDALTEAHAHDVVHRDIKPENIMLRGRHALVTDFGVAKAVSEATGREQLTTAGVALGTPAYMAPEQATADPHLDHRVDIYAVGAVGYELLTGRPVFMGTTPQMVLAAHVTEVPQPVTKYRETVPRALEVLVMRCLEKRPADRWQSAAELLAQLEVLATPSGGITPTDTQPRPAASGRRRLVPAVGVVVAAGVLAAAALLWRGASSRGAPVLTQVQLTTSGAASVPIIAPDGSQIAYQATECGAASGCSYRLVVRDLATQAEQAIVGDPRWVVPLRFSPDGARILIAASLPGEGEGAFVISRIGGAAVRLATGADSVSGWDLSENGVDFLPGGDTVLVQLGNELRSIMVTDGQVAQVVRLPDGVSGTLLGVSGDGRWMAFQGPRDFHGSAPLVLVDRRGRILDSLVPPVLPFSARWSGSRTLLALQATGGGGLEHALLRWRVSPRTGRVSRPDTVLVALTQDPPDISADGRSLVLARLSSSETELWTLEPAVGGGLRPIRKVVQSTGALDGRIAADGRTVLYLIESAGPQGRSQRLMVEDFDGGNPRPVTPPFPAAEGSDVTLANYGDRIYVSMPIGEGRTRVTAYEVATGRSQPFAELPARGVTMWAIPRGGLYWHTAALDTIHVLDEAGRPIAQVPVPQPAGTAGRPTPSVSPDGTEVALLYFEPATTEQRQSGVALYALSIASGHARLVTRAPAVGAWVPFWGDDGWIRVAMTMPSDPRWVIYRVRAEGGSLEREFTLPFERVGPVSVSLDGHRWVGVRDGTRSDLILVRGFGRPLR